MGRVTLGRGVQVPLVQPAGQVDGACAGTVALVVAPAWSAAAPMAGACREVQALGNDAEGPPQPGLRYDDLLHLLPTLHPDPPPGVALER